MISTPPLKASIQASTLQTSIALIEVVTDEAELSVSPTGLTVTVTNGSTTTAGALTLDAQLFHSFRGRDVTVGVDINNLDRFLRILDDHVTVEIRINPTTNTFLVQGPALSRTFGLLDPDTVVNPGLSPSSHSTLLVLPRNSTPFQRALTAADICDSELIISSTQSEFECRAKGDNDRMQVAISPSYTQQFDDSEATGRYETEDLQDMWSELPKDETPVTFKIASEELLTFTSELWDGNGQITYRVAHRTQSTTLN